MQGRNPGVKAVGARGSATANAKERIGYNLRYEKGKNVERTSVSLQGMRNGGEGKEDTPAAVITYSRRGGDQTLNSFADRSVVNPMC